VGETGLEELRRLELTESGPPGWRVVGWWGTAWRGCSAVIGGWLLSQETIRRSSGAQDGRDEDGGGPAWANIVVALGSGRHSLVTGE
jgi:hypothetical protein